MRNVYDSSHIWIKIRKTHLKWNVCSQLNRHSFKHRFIMTFNLKIIRKSNNITNNLRCNSANPTNKTSRSRPGLQSAEPGEPNHQFDPSLSSTILEMLKRKDFIWHESSSWKLDNLGLFSLFSQIITAETLNGALLILFWFSHLSLSFMCLVH